MAWAVFVQIGKIYPGTILSDSSLKGSFAVCDRGISYHEIINRRFVMKDVRNGVLVESATFGAGCFWHVEQVFSRVKGVVSTSVGYMGGTLPNPTYQEVCMDRSGHAEVVEVTFDPAQVSYEDLLETFWSLHDPTTPNRQGPDIGTQYRSAIFFYSPAQQAAAEASKERLRQGNRYKRPIVTEIVPAGMFYRAEEYHQHYLDKHGHGSCRL